MATPIRRRTLLAAGAGAVAAALPTAPALAGRRPSRGVGFTLNAEVLDGGEQVTSVTLGTSRLGRVDPAGLTTRTFTVHARATSPFPVGADTILSEYEGEREVTAVRLDRRGDVVLELASGEGVARASTLGYLVTRGRNVVLDLEYTITQNTPLDLRGRRPVTIPRFVQGRLVDPEVDAFRHRTSRSGLKYRLFSPDRRGRGRHRARGRRPLVVWLHGGGEGASLPDGYYDNETTLRANRGALGFATPEAQAIFGGAHVVAPQSTSFWLEDGDRFAPQLRRLVAEVVRDHDVDRDRIYLAGCSNGGYMTLKLETVYPELFAAAVPICGVVDSFRGSARLITDDQLRAVETPTWLVAAADDATVPPGPNTVHAAELIPDARLTLYDDVTWDGHRFPGHWSWIYVARNDPRQDGTTIWEWMARQRR
ncbi:Predicted peptidase [Friedmanniella luteola]|uniref:Predicted peptidase n=1 Tax=Friedmanniella luteola TaxID=546871 RepID=A0A1H1ULB4_9ACTN|nr:prolyl oligopeptidase family serine peptidase [Friedmanniella luteola]SDS73265.1 Predicted peptidase [Friedmanniella luteola]